MSIYNFNDESYEIFEEKPDHHYRTEIPNIVLKLNLLPEELAVYVHLKSICGGSGKCWKSIKNLANQCCMSENTLRRVLNNLSLRDYEVLLHQPLIKVIQRFKSDGSQDTNLITITPIWRINGDFHRQKGGGSNLEGGGSQKRKGGGSNFEPKEEPSYQDLSEEGSKQQTRAREEPSASPACQPAAAFFACIKDLPFSDKEKIALCALANEDIVSNAIAKYKQRLAEGYEPDNHYGFLKSLIIAKEKPVKAKVDSSRDNQFLALQMKNKAILPSYAYFEILSSGVEIGYTTGQKEPYLIEYDAKGFASQVENAVRKVGGNFKL